MARYGLVAAMAAAVLAAAPAAAQTTVNWNFTGNTGSMGSGQFTYGNDGIVTAFSGSYNNQVLSLVTFTSDPNNPGGGGLNNNNHDGTYTYHGVPNSNGGDFIFDNLFPINGNGIVVSTGMGADERVYDIFAEGSGVDFFSFKTDGNYNPDPGVFTTAAATGAVPEPATWAMMILGFGLVGYGIRRQLRRSDVKFDARIDRIASGDLAA